jgi:hypothetical protein
MGTPFRTARVQVKGLAALKRMMEWNGLSAAMRVNLRKKQLQSRVYSAIFMVRAAWWRIDDG